jgi:ABC-type dipeptide/oligopeptide/nickel transport system permease component
MLTFLFRRLIALIPVALGVVTLVSLMTHLVPGNPVDLILGDYATAEDKAILAKALGLDRPFFQQLMGYLSEVVRGNLGESIINHRPVLEMILERLPATAELAVTSISVAIMIAIPLGIISAMNQRTFIDYGAMTFAIAGVALPSFFFGPLLVLIFSIKLDLLPVSERGDWTTYILPSLTLGTALSAALCRMTRNSILDFAKEDFARTARAKGCSRLRVVCKHILRNASLPLITIIGLQFGVMLTGTLVSEKIFDWPGVGSLMLEGINTRDYPLVQGCVLVFSASYLIVNLLTDLVVAWLDPRIKLES